MTGRERNLSEGEGELGRDPPVMATGHQENVENLMALMGDYGDCNCYGHLCALTMEHKSCHVLDNHCNYYGCCIRTNNYYICLCPNIILHETYQL